MKKIILVAALGSLLAGCNKDYQWDEVSTSGNQEDPNSIFIDRKTNEPATGTVTWKQGNTTILQFKVVDGIVDGDWIKHRPDGTIERASKLKEGVYVGESNFYCDKPIGQLSITINYESGTYHKQQFDCSTGATIAQIHSIYAPNTNKHGLSIGNNQSWVIRNGKPVPRLFINYSTEQPGLREGITEEYNFDGILTSRTNFANDKKNGESEEFALFQDGTSRLANKTTYKDNVEVGEKYEYFTNSDLPNGIVSQITYLDDSGKTNALKSYSLERGYAKITPFNDIPNNKVLAQAMTGTWNRNHDAHVADVSGLDYLLKNSQVDLNQPIANDHSLPIQIVADNAYDYLIAQGADPAGKDFYGRTRLQNCLIDPSSAPCDTTEHYLKLAAAPSAKSVDEFGNTPLHTLCMASDQYDYRYKNTNNSAIALMNALLPTVDINATNYGQRTALHYCMMKNMNLAEVLINAGADLDIADYSGTTPMHMIFVGDLYGTRANIEWSAEKIKLAAGLKSKSKFDFSAPMPGFDKSLKQIMIENGDAKSAMLIDQLMTAPSS